MLRAELSRRAFNRGLVLVLGGIATSGLVEACGGGGNPSSGRNVRPVNRDGTGNWQVIPKGQSKFVVQLGVDADVVTATDISLPGKPNKQSVEDAINDLANN